MTMPYDEYTDPVIDALSTYEEVSEFDDGSTSTQLRVDLYARELRNLLVDAWMAGLKYSLIMIESGKRGQDVQQD